MHIVHFHAWITKAGVMLLLAGASSATGEVVHKGIIIPSLLWDTSRIKPFVFNCNDALIALFANDDTGISPCKVVLVPERIDWKDKAVDRVSKNIDDHPSNMLPLAFDDKNNRLQTIYSGNNTDGDIRDLTRPRSDEVDEIDDINTGGGENDGSEQVNEHDETHTETAESAQVFEEHQFSQVVDGRIDPASSLG